MTEMQLSQQNLLTQTDTKIPQKALSQNEILIKGERESTSSYQNTESNEETLRRKIYEERISDLDTERTSQKFTSRTEKSRVLQPQDLVKLRFVYDSEVNDLIESMTIIEQDLKHELEIGKNLISQNLDLQPKHFDHFSSTYKRNSQSLNNSLVSKSQFSNEAFKQSCLTSRVNYSPRGRMAVAGRPKEVVKEYNFDVSKTAIVDINDPINYRAKLPYNQTVDSTLNKRPKSAQPSSRLFQTQNRRNNYHLSQEQLIEQFQQKLYGECTFHPKVNDLPQEEHFKYKNEGLNSKER